MKKELKGFVVGVLVTTILSGSVVFAAGVKRNIQVEMNAVNLKVNGSKVNAENISYNGTTFVPLRAAAEILGKEVVWDGATNTANINDKVSSPAPTVPTALTGYNRSNPAPIGVKQKATVSNILDEYTVEVAIKDVIRGNAALDMVLEANMFNDEPGAEEEYILAKVYVKALVSKDDKKIDVGNYSFDLFNSGNTKYNDFISVVAPSPELSTDLYAGAEHEGYTVFKVKKSDKSPKVSYGAKYDGTGGVWFSLSK